jgi:homospermidine synthase
VTEVDKLTITGRVVVLGCGSVSQCLQPLLLDRIDMDFRRLTVIDFEDMRDSIADSLRAGATYERTRITPDNLAAVLGARLGYGDLLINLSWNIDTGDIIEWCQDHGVCYVDTSVELWDPYQDQATTPPTDRTLYRRHLRLRARAAGWLRGGPTAVVEHGANPGLVSHWTKLALDDIATTMLAEPGKLVRPLENGQRARIEEALADRDYPQLAMATGTKVIHISERDTQIADRPKLPGEFVNTWSVEGFYEEGIAPAELGWGTHEPRLPADAFEHPDGPRNQICLARTGVSTLVRSWVPLGGPIIGMVVRHGEAFTISDHLTVWDGDQPVYRPTVHYAYMPTDAAMSSFYECRMQGHTLQTAQRIMTDEITSGIDELGVLLLGHALNGWWTGSQLSIEEARRLAPGQNATTLQVAASVLGAVFWIVRNPDRGLCVPDDLDHEQVLATASPYLGPSPSIQTDWTPRQHSYDPFSGFRPATSSKDMWEFGEFLVP